MEDEQKIDETRGQLYDVYDELVKENQVITAQGIKTRYLKSDEQNLTLLYLISYHKDQMDKVLKYGTMKHYNTTEIYLKDYLKIHLKVSDIYLKQIDYQFTLGFESYLR